MNMYDIGQEIFKARKAKGWSQQKLADYSGLSRSSISLIESGSVTDLGLRRIINLCNVLSLEVTVTPKGSPKSLNDMKQEEHEQFERRYESPASFKGGV